MKRALTIGQLIANAYPADTRLLFQKYGINDVQPTGKTILDAYLVHGNQFLAELTAIAGQSIGRYSSIDGPLALETDKVLASGANSAAKAAAMATEQSKVSWSDKVFSIFSDAGKTLTTVSGAWESISNIFSGNKSVDTGSGDANVALQAEMYRLQSEAQKEAAANSTKTYLLIGAGILVVILGAIMYSKTKK